MKVLILDYEMGNLKSVFNAISYLGYNGKISNDPFEIKNSDKIMR